MGEKARGTLVIIGGAEDKTGECKILRHCVGLLGGAEQKLAILTTATEEPEKVGQTYSEVFSKIGVSHMDILHVNSREDANDDGVLARLSECRGIFFTGGDQLRITSIIGGSKLYETIQTMYNNGVVMVGTSAGASVMSSVMIVDGNSNDSARKCTLKMAPGLSLLEEAIIDQHFAQRGRIGRILTGVCENPHILGIGIDEDTAIVVSPDAHFEVIGANSVTVVDGTSIKSSNVSELKPNEILAISNITLHVLPEGYGFDMKKREVLRLH